jgi:hypothetical protein
VAPAAAASITLLFRMFVRSIAIRQHQISYGTISKLSGIAVLL